ncbi:MAG: hypothetical protein U9Q81_16705 [Pseudomonadota bacterium]|nr:hypothetical protein [Pseudomonadota bacterium]
MSILYETAEFPLRPGRGDGLLGLTFGVWASLALYTAWSGWAVDGGPDWLFPLLILLPIGLFVAAMGTSPSLRRWLLGLDLRLLIGLHATRTVGLGFLFLYVYAILPGGFAFPAGIGDAMTAAWAVWIAFSLGRGAPVTARQVARWNAFGLVDFVIAVGVGLALRSDNLGGAINTDPMGTFPLALIPLFAVPLLFITHLIVAYQLRARWREGDRIRLASIDVS